MDTGLGTGLVVTERGLVGFIGLLRRETKVESRKCLITGVPSIFMRKIFNLD